MLFLTAQAPAPPDTTTRHPAPVKTIVAIAPDTARRPAPTLTIAPDAPDRVTRRLAIRIAGAIVLLSLSTLLLYNVRSR